MITYPDKLIEKNINCHANLLFLPDENNCIATNMVHLQCQHNASYYQYTCQ